MNLPEFIRHNILAFGIGLLGLLLLLFGLFELISHSSSSSNQVQFEPASANSSTQSSDKIMVDIEGAVIKPGVYALKSDSRQVDALAAAGGLSEDADRDYVQKSVNLAKKVEDGLKIYIPRVGEQVLSTSTGGSSSTGSNSVININTATTSDLDSLPGVGAVTAGKIIAGRPYASINDLLDKKIVGQATFTKIKDQISAN